MKKITAIFFLTGIFLSNARSQVQKGEVDIEHLPVSKDHYQPEYDFDRTDSDTLSQVRIFLHDLVSEAGSRMVFCAGPMMRGLQIHPGMQDIHYGPQVIAS